MRDESPAIHDSLARVGAQWQSQWTGSGRLEGSGYAGDGRAYVLLGPDSDTASPTMLTLASRTAPGTWSTSPRAGYFMDPVPDPLVRPRRLGGYDHGLGEHGGEVRLAVRARDPHGVEG